ncbi:MAG: hypothetical protein KJO07_24105, partial [Deltaproteobacteria bacterium]|nr:hypothetical protein [Deltaproteobacteria bacterium]
MKLLKVLAPAALAVACTGSPGTTPTEPEVYTDWCTETATGPGGEIVRENHFDDQGRLLETLEYHDGKLSKREANTATDNGRVSEVSDGNGAVLYRTDVAFRADGKPMHAIEESADGVGTISDQWNYT